MNISFVFAKSRLDKIESLASGQIPSDFFYGAKEILEKGHFIKLFEFDGKKNDKLLFRIFLFLERKLFLPVRTTSELLAHSREYVDEFEKFDVVVVTQSGTAFALVIWKFILRKKFEIVAIHCGLLDRPATKVQNYFMKFLFRKMRSIVFGDGELKELINRFGIPAGLISVNRFGVDTTFWKPDIVPVKEKFILAVGSDRERDYDLLVAAAKKINVKIKIITKLTIKGQVSENVEIVSGSWHAPALTDRELRDMYRGALFVVIPLRQSYKPSGQSVALQAMACGKAVVLSKISGLWDKEFLIHKENIYFVPPASLSDLVSALEILIYESSLRQRIEEEARSYVLQKGNIMDFATRLEDICEKSSEKHSIYTMV